MHLSLFLVFFTVAGRCLLSLLIRCSILKNSSSKGQSPWRVDELNRIIILYLLTELIERSVLSICDDSWVFCLFICASLSLFHRSTARFGRPSGSPYFLHSLTLPHYVFRISLRSVQDTTPEGVLSSCGCPLTLTLNTSIGIWHGAGATKSWSSVLSMFCSWLISVNFLFVLSLGRCVANWSIPPPNGNLFGKLKWIIILSRKVTRFSRHFSAAAQAVCYLAYSSLHLCLSVSPRHNFRRRSLSMLVLSHSDTHYLNRHMVGCGCHEILIQRCIPVICLSSFSLYSIQLWFC